MKISNTDRWLLVLKEGDVTFDDIQKTINQLPESSEFDYDSSTDKHAVFHLILSDLDKLCQKGEAERTFKRVNEAEVSEIYRITDTGRMRAENLKLKGQGHQK